MISMCTALTGYSKYSFGESNDAHFLVFVHSGQMNPIINSLSFTFSHTRAVWAVYSSKTQ